MPGRHALDPNPINTTIDDLFRADHHRPQRIGAHRDYGTVDPELLNDFNTLLTPTGAFPDPAPVADAHPGVDSGAVDDLIPSAAPGASLLASAHANTHGRDRLSLVPWWHVPAARLRRSRRAS